MLLLSTAEGTGAAGSANPEPAAVGLDEAAESGGASEFRRTQAARSERRFRDAGGRDVKF